MANLSKISALAIHDPKRAKQRLRAALAAHDGNLTHTAATLGVSYRTVLRLCQRFGLQETAQAMREYDSTVIPEKSDVSA